MSEKKKLFIITSDDWYFLSHRVPVAKAAKRAGYEIYVVTGPGKRRENVWAMGYRHIVLPALERGRGGLIRRIRGIMALAKLLNDERPSIVFAVSLRFGLMSKIAGTLKANSQFIILMPGLGFLYSSDRLVARVILPFLNAFMSWLFNDENTDIIVQNHDNMLFFRQHINIPIERLHLIRGSGIQLHEHVVTEIGAEETIIILAGRMLWSKGVLEFVQAARILRAQGRDVRMVLVGVPDAANPDHVSSEVLRSWKEDGTIEWWGFHDDMNEVWRSASIAVFPTWYGEGIPKALLEAASYSLPIITTNVAGCRDVVSNEINGLLIKPRSAEALANAISLYLEDPKMAKNYGEALQATMKKNYDEETIIDETEALIRIVTGRTKSNG